MMTRKDFELLAANLAWERSLGRLYSLTSEEYSEVVRNIAWVCEKSNPSFQLERFEAACTPDRSEPTVF
jgi:hypothetical protein